MSILNNLIWAFHRRNTMIPRKVYLDNLALAESVAVYGCVVECGTWKGGMIAGIECVTQRICYGFDSFEGLPEAKGIDGNLQDWQQRKGADYHNNCIAEYESVATKYKEVLFIKGWFSSTLLEYKNDIPPIAILRLDGDLYESTMSVFENLYEGVVKSGLVVIDDYDAWDGCALAVHDFLSKNKIPARLKRTKNQVTYFIKP